MSIGGLRGLLREAELRGQGERENHEVAQLLASEEARRSLRKAARLAAAGFPQEIDQATRRRLSPVAIKACGKVGDLALGTARTCERARDDSRRI